MPLWKRPLTTRTKATCAWRAGERRRLGRGGGPQARRALAARSTHFTPPSQRRTMWDTLSSLGRLFFGQRRTQLSAAGRGGCTRGQQQDCDYGANRRPRARGGRHRGAGVITAGRAGRCTRSWPHSETTRGRCARPAARWGAMRNPCDCPWRMDGTREALASVATRANRALPLDALRQPARPSELPGHHTPRHATPDSLPGGRGSRRGMGRGGNAAGGGGGLACSTQRFARCNSAAAC